MVVNVKISDFGKTINGLLHRYHDASGTDGTKFLVLAPLVKERKGEHREVIEQVRKSGFTRVRVDGIVLSDDSILRYRPTAYSESISRRSS